MIPISRVFKAYESIKHVIKRTPLSHAPFLSEQMGVDVYLKKENLQLTGAYKLRGAFHKISALSDQERRCGVVAASAGNHAQGVAYSAREHQIPATIVMPESTPLLKVTGVRQLGSEVILQGYNYDDAYAYAWKYAQENGAIFIHPFADDMIIAGQGTVALEMIEERSDLDIILVPIGGGGLISGVSAVYRQLHPEVKIIGVTAKGAPAMHDSFWQKRSVDSERVKTIADGIAVRSTNTKTLEYILECVDEVVQVEDEEIASAILFLLEKQKLVVEGAGATGVAALMHQKFDYFPDSKIGIVLSGGNIDVTMLNIIIEKGLRKSARKMNLVITLIDKPGSLMELTEIFTALRANIVQVGYDRTSTTLEYGDANITIALETKGIEHREEIRYTLAHKGYQFSERH
jgi:threonine dehydratase